MNYQADMYLIGVVNQVKGGNGGGSVVLATLSSIINTWGANGSLINDISISGSCAKETNLRGQADVDIFVSVASHCTNTLKEIFDSLEVELQRYGYTTRRQNVSLGITCNGYAVDVVPGKKDTGNTNYHKLYKSKTGSWVQTNIQHHINTVKAANRTNEIILTKRWRDNHGLDFPSIYLELTVINALKYKNANNLANNFWSVLEYLRDSFTSARVVDPANTNNIISDELSSTQKSLIASQARNSLTQQNWGSIVW